MNIGVFDSGLGGLSILKELIKQLPQYNYIYLGDNARVPYGGRSPEVVYEFTTQALDFLFSQNCHLVIIACNTASAAALRKIQHDFIPQKHPNKRVLGVIKPTAETVAENKAKKVGVIATYSTVKSQSFIKEITKLNPSIKIWQNPAPLLVPIIEENELKWKGLKLILKKYLQPLLTHQINTLVLGCTHYGLIEETIQQMIGKKIKVIYQGKVVAQKLKEYLIKHPNLDRNLAKESQYQFFVTDLNSRYVKMARFFFSKPIKIKQVHLT